MITFYSKASNGDIAESRFKNWDWVNYSILTLVSQEEPLGIKFKFISFSEFKRLKKGKKVIGGGRLSLDGQHAGSFTEYR